MTEVLKLRKFTTAVAVPLLGSPETLALPLSPSSLDIRRRRQLNLTIPETVQRHLL